MIKVMIMVRERRLSEKNKWIGVSVAHLTASS